MIIDFSIKHNVMIRNREDNIIRHMDDPFFESKMIANGVWRILSDGCITYLVEGDDEALVIDSGYGYGNIRNFCQMLTNRPVRRIANTHDHFDHTAYNSYFESAIMSKETAELATLPFPSFEGIKFPRDYKIEIIEEGDVIDLGNRTLKVLSIPDHAVGSLAFLDVQSRIMFCGDELSPMGKIINTSVEKAKYHMEKLNSYSNNFDWLCSGHFEMIEANIIDKIVDNLNYILDGNEGTASDGWPMLPEEEFDQNGNNIYIRNGARVCDINSGKKRDGQEYKRVSEYAGCRVIYDVRNVYEP